MAPESVAPLLLDVGQVALLLEVSTKTVRRLADSGRMPTARRLGRLLRWSRAELEEWIERGCPRVRSVVDRDRWRVKSS